MKIQKPKRTAIAVLLSAGLSVTGLSPAVAGGIPVFDSAGVAQAVQQVIHLKQQIENQVAQLKELQSQVKALTGSRNLGELAKNIALDHVPEEWKAVYGDIKNLDTKAITGKDRYKHTNAADALVKSYKQAAKTVADTVKRFKTIEQLSRQINLTQDAKAAADLQNRISIEQSKITTNQVMLDMAMKLAEQQEKIQMVQQQNIIACQIQAKSKAERKECGSI
ncbi:type IV secretion system protein [Neisseria musculi]|uniref:Type IV secretion system family protein n=1 Tax=Neisseria musculi TaxID=1815583 RepID=A0A7H1MDT8_9NEIS|nr:type IV secretion system protein [Neisseria musculi]QNT59803.1 type IV secretion system family protein [Neisseria musculi]